MTGTTDRHYIAGGGQAGVPAWRPIVFDGWGRTFRRRDVVPRIPVGVG